MTPRTPEPDKAVYVISVAAELTGLHPQTLRTYDRMGLVSPGRAGGGGRRYSWRDIELLREVAELTAAGIGLEGVRRILELEDHVAVLSARRLRPTSRTASRSASRVASSSATSSSLRARSASTWCSSSRIRRTPSIPAPDDVSSAMVRSRSTSRAEYRRPPPPVRLGAISPIRS